jgi:L-threonylcarbamoyladenylate synthase
MILTIKDAAAQLRSGGVVALPTETVYGLGANALDADAVRRIYELKGRPSTSPLIVHVSSIEMARELVTEWPAMAEELARKWWPGPLSLVLPKRSAIPDIVTAGLFTVGIRMPSHPVALELINEAGIPLAAPSANKFTGISPTTAQHVRDAFGDAVPVLDGGPCSVGIESTVVAIQGNALTLLRPGMVALGELELASAETGGAHPAPGMHHRHYSPRTPLLLVDYADQIPDKTGGYVWHRHPAMVERHIKLPDDPEKYAAQLYATLHLLDSEHLPWIAVEMPQNTPEWNAVRDRLSRAQSPLHQK